MMTAFLVKRARHFGFVVLMVTVALSASADSGDNHQTASNLLGTSGGNVNDLSTLYCCSGTLGSLVEDTTGVKYILSNNHVLARSNNAQAGEDVSQPGLIDNACRAPFVVADLSAYPSLTSSNVDAAIARLRPGGMDSSGFIMDIGTISRVVRVPSVGLSVQKSGRTSGRTTGVISSINTTVKVQYQPRCGMGKKFTVTFRNQVVIGPGSFSTGGDSGSLIVTNVASEPQPVALLFAGSSSATIANPIGEVLTQVSNSLGSPVRFVGSDTVTSGSTSTGGATQSTATPESIRKAHAGKDRLTNAFFSRPDVLGVGVGSSSGDGAPAIVVYIDNAAAATRRNIPSQVDGTPVQIVFTEPFVSY